MVELMRAGDVAEGELNRGHGLKTGGRAGEERHGATLARAQSCGEEALRAGSTGKRE